MRSVDKNDRPVIVGFGQHESAELSWRDPRWGCGGGASVAASGEMERTVGGAQPGVGFGGAESGSDNERCGGQPEDQNEHDDEADNHRPHGRQSGTAGSEVEGTPCDC